MNLLKSSALFILFVLSSGILRSTELITIHDFKNVQYIGLSVEMFEDTSCALSLDEVQSDSYSSKFVKTEKEVFSIPTTESCYWFRFKIKNETGKALWAEPCDNRIWYIDFYSPNEKGSYTKTEAGRLRSRAYSSVSDNNYCFLLAKENEIGEKVFYGRSRSNFPQKFWFKVGTVKALQDSFGLMELVNSLFLGVMIAIILYTVFFFLSTRALIYLYYLLFLVMVTLITPLDNGFVFMDSRWMIENITILHAPLFLFQSIFLTKYLKLSVLAPRLNRTILGLTGVIVIVIPLLTFFNLAKPGTTFILLQLTAVVLYFFSLWACVVALKAGEVRARFFMYGWIILIFGTFVFLFAANGILPLGWFTLSSMYWGFGLESLLFGLALADHLNLIIMQKKEALEQNIVLVKGQNEKLERLVKDRTKEIRTKNRDLEFAYSEIQLKNKEVIDSINYAKRIQDALLNIDLGFKKHFKDDYLIFYQPKDIVSGDFYYLTEKSDVVILAAVDCTGHGVPGAFMTMIANNILNQIIHDMEVLNPGKILSLLSELLVKNFENTNKQAVKDGMDVSLVALTKENGMFSKLQFAGSVQSLYYIAEGEVREIKGSKIPISINKEYVDDFKGEEFTVHELEVTPDLDTFYLSTDGYPDQFGGPRDKKFMIRKFKQLLLDNQQLSMKKQQSIIKEAFFEWKDTGNSEQVDDVTVLGVRLNQTRRKDEL